MWLVLVLPSLTRVPPAAAARPCGTYMIECQGLGHGVRQMGGAVAHLLQGLLPQRLEPVPGPPGRRAGHTVQAPARGRTRAARLTANGTRHRRGRVDPLPRVSSTSYGSLPTTLSEANLGVQGSPYVAARAAAPQSGPLADPRPSRCPAPLALPPRRVRTTAAQAAARSCTTARAPPRPRQSRARFAPTTARSVGRPRAPRVRLRVLY